MRELGKRLGVSAVTVSKALSGKPGVSDIMRHRIIDLAEELGYVKPNTQPGGKNQSLDVGILVPERFFSSESFYAMFCKRLVQELTAQGHFGILELLSDDMLQSLALPNVLRGRRVDGVVLLGEPGAEYARMMIRQSLPVVCTDFFEPSLSADTVISDNIGGAAELTRHLINQGHRDIAFLGNVKATSSIMERYLGFCGMMKMHDLPVRPEYVMDDRDARGALLPLVLPARRPTALLCNCDLVARWAVDQLTQQGLRVPQDISVIGFDDFLYTPATVPALTTYRVDVDGMCRLAVRMLIERCAGSSRPVLRVVTSGQCVFRDSVRNLNDPSSYSDKKEG